ncbi:hypothetical protein JOF56_002007 [Kibdelosporangium banguiense]|uniref:DUF2690 domain-containing protein n=1 Tax=Kibdelosporangium banguiense TaxID=1365924 RepID=A0ABS4TB22_9PSEU|nr:hypothetical protein [Kibdelosporangium banguiense]
MRKSMQAALLTITTAAALSTTATPTTAAVTADSPIEACGGGSYHQVDSHKLGNVATIRLLYNGTTNCVVTWRTNPGTPRIAMLASIAKQDANGNFGDYKHNDGNFTTYAGPVKVSASGRCIDWGGAATINGVYTLWMSGPSHCD